jgi:hypothetical protein
LGCAVDAAGVGERGVIDPVAEDGPDGQLLTDRLAKLTRLR